MKISKTILVNQLTAAAVNRRGAFLIEMAVGLAVYTSHGAVNKTSRADLYSIYHAVGYDCLNADGRDYRTVHRRVAAAGHLFEHTGSETIQAWTSGHAGKAALGAIVARIEHLDVATIDGVLAMTGRPRAPSKPRERQEAANEPLMRRAADRGVHIDVGHAHVQIEDDASHADIMALVARLVELAAERLKVA